MILKPTLIILISTFFTLGSTIQVFSQSDSCDPSYPDVCIPPYPPDLNCNDISDKNFRVLYPDPHKFDREEDGIGCET